MTGRAVVPSIETSPFLALSKELRLTIYEFLLLSDRPFMIGRMQDHGTSRSSRRSPRDVNQRHRPVLQRHNERHRPIQPPMTRVSRLIRDEALPVFYAINHFWLIHNEFQPWPKDLPTYRLPGPGRYSELYYCDARRGFHPWLQQTPRSMFNVIQRITLCGYVCWPDRIMIHIDLKARKITGSRHYTTYGDDIVDPPSWAHFNIEKSREALEDREHEDGFEALEAVIQASDTIWRMVDDRDAIARPLGMGHIQQRQIAHGWEFDW
ncbi:hypothetical protein CKM354_001029600 [Cercospora kikuchii]|uniref:Uncharacterized protein n=1 Tax=Cercospora kikuchii TaxID=84275 RepID=A0A9P3CTB3_9PEZI|nr:uncharacterized protein CKM354_001029600 [Cercospora kikuchii]GIZ47197.1 hypothetical protein CKM354_001029600 [Cercospora kikuchii]